MDQAADGLSGDRRVPREAPLVLARRAEFILGNALVRPSLRAVEGPKSRATAEPRAIQVLVALADAAGAVLSRDDLLRVCWDGRIVGDDAINRAIGEVRKLAIASGADFAIETIPRIGYRLTIPGREAGREEASALAPKAVTRRLAIGMGLALAAAGAIVWRRQDATRAAELVDEGRRLYEIWTKPARARATRLFGEAARLDQNNAAALGWLSLAQFEAADDLPQQRWLEIFDASRETAQRALELDPGQPGARLTLAVLSRGLDDWIAFERQLAEILADDPRLTPALNYAMLLFQGLGRCRESLVANQSALAAAPFSPLFQWRRAMKHWIFGQLTDADRVISSALDLWPNEPLVWNTRLVIYGFTDRPRAGLAMLADAATRPALTPDALAAWQAGLHALDTKSSADITAAERACARAAQSLPGMAANAVMLLTALGALDTAYAVAEGVLTQRGELAQRPAIGRQPTLYGERRWRGTQWLFTPATAALRADPRFTSFCESIGYVDYWRERRIWPDPFVRGSLVPD